jgi:hypothetical protein
MNRVILSVVGVLFLVIMGCSDKQEKIKPKENKEINTSVIIDNNLTNDTNLTNITKEENKTIVEHNETDKIMMVVPEEFIPEHIKRSHIEVVPH